jgi:DNA polymerase-1
VVTLLIDADIVAFKYAASNETVFNWGDGILSKHVNEDFEAIKLQVKECLDGYLEQCEADELLICLSDDKVNWRNKVLPSYKMHRKEGKSTRPEWLYPLKEHLAEAYPSYRRATLEADDVMGILSTHPKLVSGKKIIVSEDKDMKTIPGWLFNPRKDHKPRLVTELEANVYHMRQTLIGDATDGYKGCPGAGDKAFDKLLIGWTEGDWFDLWERVVTVYTGKGYSEKDALVQARVSSICRHINYDFINKEVKLWAIPKQKTK